MNQEEEREFKSFFKDLSDGNEARRCNYTTRLDTYGTGCAHDCKYCYAKSLLSFRGMWRPHNPAVADIEEIRKTIKKELHPHEIVRLGGMTDCFQPAERQHRVTLATIKELNKAGVGYLIVTKNKLVAEDEYIKAMDKSLAHIQVSITTTDAGISKRYEPGASLPEERIAAVERLQREGFDVAVRLSPYIPQFVNIVLCCKHCNSQKGSLSLTDYSFKYCEPAIVDRTMLISYYAYKLATKLNKNKNG